MQSDRLSVEGNLSHPDSELRAVTCVWLMEKVVCVQNTISLSVFSTPLPEPSEGMGKKTLVALLHLLKVQFSCTGELLHVYTAAHRASPEPQPVLSYLPLAAQVI